MPETTGCQLADDVLNRLATSPSYDAVVELIKANYLILSLVRVFINQVINVANTLLVERKARCWQQVPHCLRLHS